MSDAPAAFGELLPWGDPNWYRGYRSPYYGPSHEAWRARARAFVEENLPAADMKEWENSKRLPKELFRKTAKAGFLPCVVGEWPEEHAGPKPDGYDHFFEYEKSYIYEPPLISSLLLETSPMLRPGTGTRASFHTRQ